MNWKQDERLHRKREDNLWAAASDVADRWDIHIKEARDWLAAIGYSPPPHDPDDLPA